MSALPGPAACSEASAVQRDIAACLAERAPRETLTASTSLDNLPPCERGYAVEALPVRSVVDNDEFSLAVAHQYGTRIRFSMNLGACLNRSSHSPSAKEIIAETMMTLCAVYAFKRGRWKRKEV